MSCDCRHSLNCMVINELKTEIASMKVNLLAINTKLDGLCEAFQVSFCDILIHNLSYPCLDGLEVYRF